MKYVTTIAFTILMVMGQGANAQPKFSVNIKALHLPTLDQRHITETSEIQDLADIFYSEDLERTATYFGTEFQLQEDQIKSPKSAFKRAFAHTAVPVVSSLAILIISNPNFFSDEGAGVLLFSSLLFFYGTTIGPSAGNLYAHDLNRGIGGILVRSLSWYFILSNDNNSTMEDIGLVGLVGSGLYNIATGPVSARQYNRSVNARISPSFNPVSKSLALTLKLQF